MTELERRLNMENNLVEGTHLDVEIYKDIEKDSEYLSVFISHEGSSGVNYPNIKNYEDIGRAVSSYVEYYM